jgi:antitoxin component YwqK of YwqJK toxin-antitoxin module
MGKRQGKEKMWDALGRPLFEIEYEKDLPVGTARVWHPNGQLKKEIAFYKGWEDCHFLEWDEEGVLIENEPHGPEPMEAGAQYSLEKTRKAIVDLDFKLGNLIGELQKIEKARKQRPSDDTEDPSLEKLRRELKAPIARLKSLLKQLREGPPDAKGN